MDPNIFYHDNESRIKTAKNAVKSCRERSRHIKIGYFFVKDILENENTDVKHCAMECILADFLTNPLRGSLFRRMMDVIMGIAPFQTEECVDELKKVSAVAAGAKNDTGVSKKATFTDMVRKNAIYGTPGELCGGERCRERSKQ